MTSSNTTMSKLPGTETSGRQSSKEYHISRKDCGNLLCLLKIALTYYIFKALEGCSSPLEIDILDLELEILVLELNIQELELDILEQEPYILEQDIDLLRQVKNILDLDLLEQELDFLELELDIL